MRSSQFYINTKAIAWVTVGTALFSLIFASGKFADGSAGSYKSSSCDTSVVSPPFCWS